jgi:oxygen-independent coproporphyrinogen-3 oxidase
MRLYVHWPFCVSRCSYCDFNSRVASKRFMRDYMRALLAELDLWACRLKDTDTGLRSVYLGGGTPSTLSGKEISGLLGGIAERFGMHEDAEISVEVNPATWTAEDHAAACAGGVNRVSIGVQSLHDPFLSLLGRAHDATDAIRAIRDAKSSGAASVSVDLLFGLPGMDVGLLLNTLREILETKPHHVSLYALTLSEKSPLSRAISRGEISLPDEDDVAEQYLVACEVLSMQGYEHYEISNFCMPGHHSRHNMAYWGREEYLGVGAGAHSFLGRNRFHNTSSLLAYIRAMAEGRLTPQECERIDATGELEENIMLGLRTSLGVPASIIGIESQRLEDLENRGLLRRKEGRVHLTRRGMLVSNALIAEMLPA